MLKRQSGDIFLVAESARHLPSLVLDKESPFSRLHQLPRLRWETKRDAFRLTKLGAPIRAPVARAWRPNDLMRMVGANFFFFFCFLILHRAPLFPCAEFSNRHTHPSLWSGSISRRFPPSRPALSAALRSANLRQASSDFALVRAASN